MKIEFAPGCFDNFEGTQEELDAIVKEIQELAESGALLANSEPIDWDSLSKEEREVLIKLEERTIQ